jgi:DNA invertase Pin-like site-specific DNA recombinase
MVPYIHVFDDGYSGTGWNRPGWQKVIEEIEAGRVQNLVIKNLDRMGRDYLRVGLYLEQFQSCGVRLIAVSDGIDTSRGDDDFTPFRAIFAEWFARDTSKKIKAVINAKGRSGKPTTIHPPYGYIKDSEDKYKWLVDSDAATVVKRIFNMAMDSIGPNEIARTLTTEKVERPSYYLGKRERGCRRHCYDEALAYTWNCSSVIEILSNKSYCGHTVNFKTKKTSYKIKSSKPAPPDEWLIFENTHEAIITQEVFDTVQKLRGTPRRIDHFGEANPLTGLLYCFDCGAKLYNSRSDKQAEKNINGKTYLAKKQDDYVCSTHKMATGKFVKKCSSHYIRTEAVREIILEVLRKTAGYVREYEHDFIEHIRASAVLKKGETSKSYQKQISKNERRVAELNKVLRSLYEDKALGKISEERYNDMSAGYEQELADIKAQTAAMQTELDEFSANNAKPDNFIALIRKYTHFEELTTPMINELVEKVVVHEGEYPERNGKYRGTRIQEVEVYLKYIGKYDVPDTRSVEEIEAEIAANEKADRERIRKREWARQNAEKKKETTEKPAPAAEPAA